MYRDRTPCTSGTTPGPKQQAGWLRPANVSAMCFSTFDTRDQDRIRPALRTRCRDKPGQASPRVLVTPPAKAVTSAERTSGTSSMHAAARTRLKEKSLLLTTDHRPPARGWPCQILSSASSGERQSPQQRRAERHLKPSREKPSHLAGTKVSPSGRLLSLCAVRTRNALQAL